MSETISKETFEAAMSAVKRNYKAKIKALREALEKYGTHLPDCGYAISYDGFKCDCGFNKVMKKDEAENE